MEHIKTFDDRAIRELLAGGNPDQLVEAFTQVDTHLRKPFVIRARSLLPEIRPEDLAAAWRDTLRELLKAVRARTMDTERELWRWLATIFIQRALNRMGQGISQQELASRATKTLSRTTSTG